MCAGAARVGRGMGDMLFHACGFLSGGVSVSQSPLSAGLARILSHLSCDLLVKRFTGLTSPLTQPLARQVCRQGGFIMGGFCRAGFVDRAGLSVMCVRGFGLRA